MRSEHCCPACGSAEIYFFYEIDAVPVHSVLLLDSREEAVNYVKGDINLAFCRRCGFIHNHAFVGEVHEYSNRYEPTQGYSETFNTFHRQLALDIIERYDVRRKQIIEIGCGQGEFLHLLCELGDNQGIGFDPAYAPVRPESTATGRARFIRDFYSEKYSGYRADFVCCKMTLEHISDVSNFISTVYRSVSRSPEAVVFFQVPNARRILRDVAFWDIYYEHCSYFSLGSLARLFRREGFTVLDLWRDYDEQYLMIVAQADSFGAHQAALPEEEQPEQLGTDVTCFADRYRQKLDHWRRMIQTGHNRGQRIVLWGGGSKAVAFLTTLAITEEIEVVVDINPRKHGTFIAGTGQRIVSPDYLRDYEPDLVIIMNPIYQQEITERLTQMGLEPSIQTV